MSDEKNQPFESFNALYKILSWTGYFQLMKKPKNRWKWICHGFYRVLSFLMAILFNLQHLLFIVQVRNIFKHGKLNRLFKYLHNNCKFKSE